METRGFARAGLLTLGMTLGAALAIAGAKLGASPANYQGKSPKEAAESLLQLADKMSEEGSWELIAIGRVYYLSGDQEKGEAYFNRAVAKKAAESDWRRIAAIYTEAKDYDKAIATLQKALVKSPKESRLFAEIGAAYNLKGDRAKAEEMFAQSFANDPESLWNAVNAAASYVGVNPN